MGKTLLGSDNLACWAKADGEGLEDEATAVGVAGDDVEAGDEWGVA